MRNFTTVIFVILLLLSTLGFAVDDGGTESVFSIGAGARAMGMGNAFVGLADDASAVYYNPSGLPYLPSQQISFLHTILFEETVYDYLSYVYPHNRSALGVAVMRLGTDDIGRRDREYYDLGRFSASQLQFMVSYSSRIKKNISAGLALKMAHHSIDNYSAYGFGLDASGHFKISKRISAGLLLQDIIGAKIQLISEKERTPFTFKAGLAYKLGHEFSTLRANLVFDADKPENRSLKIRTGFEVIHRNGLILRSGYDRDNFTLGMGIRYQDLIFDYAYKFIDHLSDSHRFSFTYNFGLSLEEREAIQTESNRRYSEHIIAENRRQSLLHELKKADRYYDRGVFDSSLTAYYRADAFADEKGYIQSRIDDIQSILSAQRSLPPAIIIDSSGTSFGVDFLGQAQRLYAQKSLISARDMVRIARKFDSASPELDSLDLAITVAINDVINDNISLAKIAYGKGNYVSAYDYYNTVLVYSTRNSLARKGSQMSEKRLALAQHINLGLDYFNQGKYISSQKAFNRVLKIDSKNITAKEYMSKINIMIKESTSLEDLQNDEQIWQVYLDGLEAFRRGEYDKAIELWEGVLEVYPNNKNTKENIEQARLRLNK